MKLPIDILMHCIAPFLGLRGGGCAFFSLCKLSTKESHALFFTLLRQEAQRNKPVLVQ